MKLLAGIVGYRGYSGAELVKILSRHGGVEPVLLEHRHDATAGGHLCARPPCAAPPPARNRWRLLASAVLLATPPEVSMDLAPQFLDAGAVVVDLSGAFRLRTPERYQHWYKEVHTAPELLPQAVYGLPEYTREQVRSARLISNPGCYPTAANLAIRPLAAGDQRAGTPDGRAG